MTIRVARTDAERAACFPVMHQLRPHLASEDFVARVRAQEESGYRLAYVDEGDGPVAVAGFRLLDTLVDGHHLYVDDLVTDERARSRGHGARLLAWLLERARQEGCTGLQLDSGVQRTDAHRFYEREGLRVKAYHFEIPLYEIPLDGEP